MESIIIIAVNKYNHGCNGYMYKNVRESIANGAYSVWNYNRIKCLNELTSDPIKHFKEYMKANGQVGITKERFFRIIETMPDKESHIEFYNECLENF